MSDALADHLYAAVQAVPILPNDTQNDIDYRVYKALSSAARAFIGDEIADLRLDRPDEQRITVREVEVWNQAIDAATTTIRNGAKK